MKISRFFFVRAQVLNLNLSNLLLLLVLKAVVFGAGYLGNHGYKGRGLENGNVERSRRVSRSKVERESGDYADVLPFLSIFRERRVGGRGRAGSRISDRRHLPVQSGLRGAAHREGVSRRGGNAAADDEADAAVRTRDKQEINKKKKKTPEKARGNGRGGDTFEVELNKYSTSMIIGKERLLLSLPRM